MLHLRSNCSIFGGPGDVAGVAGITMYGTLLCICACSCDSVAAAAVVAAVAAATPLPIVAMCDSCVGGGFNKHDGLSGGVISEYCDTSGIEAVADLVSRW